MYKSCEDYVLREEKKKVQKLALKSIFIGDNINMRITEMRSINNGNNGEKSNKVELNNTLERSILM